jgi:hypothetical protein
MRDSHPRCSPVPFSTPSGYDPDTTAGQQGLYPAFTGFRAEGIEPPIAGSKPAAFPLGYAPKTLDVTGLEPATCVYRCAPLWVSGYPWFHSPSAPHAHKHPLRSSRRGEMTSPSREEKARCNGRTWREDDGLSSSSSMATEPAFSTIRHSSANATRGLYNRRLASLNTGDAIRDAGTCLHRVNPGSRR